MGDDASVGPSLPLGAAVEAEDVEAAGALLAVGECFDDRQCLMLLDHAASDMIRTALAAGTPTLGPNGSASRSR
jgi:hypothetical protein